MHVIDCMRVTDQELRIACALQSCFVFDKGDFHLMICYYDSIKGDSHLMISYYDTLKSSTSNFRVAPGGMVSPLP